MPQPAVLPLGPHPDLAGLYGEQRPREADAARAADEVALHGPGGQRYGEFVAAEAECIAFHSGYGPTFAVPAGAWEAFLAQVG
ncbi:hypothetical protein ACFYXV_21090 [Streptomyces sp. NPDC002181]|uniref:hypothetical protein n=1 Tax=Streptomyces sp. NPDC002181 TaxID=3364635 RepID=UPI0036BA996A